jgi:hypothetical protein
VKKKYEAKVHEMRYFQAHENKNQGFLEES